MSTTGLDESQLAVRDPDGTSQKPDVGASASGDVPVRIERPLRPGFYTLVRDTTRMAEAAVNVDTQESNLVASSLPAKRLKGVSVVHAGESFRTDLRQAREGREIYAVFVMLAIVALVGESVLGRKA